MIFVFPKRRVCHSRCLLPIFVLPAYYRPILFRYSIKYSLLWNWEASWSLSDTNTRNPVTIPVKMGNRLWNFQAQREGSLRSAWSWGLSFAKASTCPALRPSSPPFYTCFLFVKSHSPGMGREDHWQQQAEWLHNNFQLRTEHLFIPQPHVLIVTIALTGLQAGLICFWLYSICALPGGA